MRKPAIHLLALLAFCTALFAAEPAPLRTALLAWEPIPARPDVQRVASDLVALAQAELSAEPSLAWVERAELDKLLGEADLAASGRLDPRASLRIGKLARAQLLVTGRLDASDFANTTLTLEVLDLDRGDLLASSTTPIPARPHKHYTLRDEDRATAITALRELLATAASRHHELAAKPAVALLFLANSGPSSRLDAAGERLADTLRDSATTAGARVLRFPRARDADAEQDLVPLGLAEADDQAWRGVADLYVWGEYKELPADGLAFEDTPVEAALTLWNGVSEPRTHPWRGVVADFPRSAETFAAVLAPALRRAAAAADPTARATAARLLIERTVALEKFHPLSVRTESFWKAPVGLNFQNHRLQLLQLAAFLDPASADTQLRLFGAVNTPMCAAPPASAVLWRHYADLRRLAGRFPDPEQLRPNGFEAHYGRNTHIEVLESLMRTLARRLGPDDSDGHAQLLRAGELWSRDILRHAAWLDSQPDSRAADKKAFGLERLDFVLDTGDYMIPTLSETDAGTDVIRRLVESTWPVLGPAFQAYHKEKSDAAERTALDMITVFRAVGAEDRAYNMLRAVLEAPTPATPAARRPAPEAATPDAQPPDPEPVGPAWGDTPAAASHPFAGPLLPLAAHTLAWWREAARTSQEADFRTALLRYVSGNPPADEAVRLLGFDGHRLWLDAPPLPDSSAEEKAQLALATFSPYARSLDGISLLPVGARAVAVTAAADTLYLASDLHGLWRLGPEARAARHFTPADGLPSLKLAAIAVTDQGLIAAAAPPENTLARLDPTQDRWINISVPSGAASTPLRLAGLGPWLLVGRDQPHLLDTRSGEWSAALEAYRERLPVNQRARPNHFPTVHSMPAVSDPGPDWSMQSPRALLADAEAFWLAGDFGLVRFDPTQGPENALWEKCPPVRAFADAGPHLWVAFTDTEAPADLGQPLTRAHPALRDASPQRRATWLGCYNKANRRWLGSLQVSGVVTTLAAAPGFVWAGGTTLHEIDLGKIDSESFRRAAAFFGPDHAARFAGLPEPVLHEAAAHDDIPALNRLIAAGVRPDPVGSGGHAPLHAATRFAGPEAVSVLLAAGAVPDVATTDGQTPLGLAVARGDLALLDLLIARGATPGFQARPHLAFVPPRQPGGIVPTTTPTQPAETDIKPIPDGRVRIHWTSAASDADAFTIYRRDDRPDQPHVFSSRNGTLNQEWANIGSALVSVRGDQRAWIDSNPRPADATSTYFIIAENARDRHGPEHPRPVGVVSPSTAPAAPATPARLGELPLTLRDPAPLLLAAAGGHDDIVDRLLAGGAAIDAVDANGHGVLHYAILGGHSSLANRLLGRGAPIENVAAGAKPGRFPKRSAPPLLGPDLAGSALQYAYAARADRALFRALLAAGADPGSLATDAAALGREDDVEELLAASPHPFVSNQYRHTAFVAALNAGRARLAGRLRERCFAPSDPRWPASRGSSFTETALLVALQRKDRPTFEWLLERVIGTSSDAYRDPLEFAVTQKMLAEIRLLIAKGADPGSLPKGLGSKIADPDVRAALQPIVRSTKIAPDSASVTGVGPPTRFPMPWSAQSTDLYFGRRPSSSYGALTRERSEAARLAEAELRAAARRGDLPGIHSALAAGALIDGPDEKGWTALIHATAESQADAVRTLLDAGATLNIVSSHGSTPLAFAAGKGDRELVAELLDLGADPNVAAGNSGTALVMAVHRGHLPVVRLLLDRGAHPQLVSPYSGSYQSIPPLFFAARAGRLDVIRLLIEHGADPNLILWRGQWAKNPVRCLTALPFAAISNDLPTLEYFLGLGLDPTLADAYGDNALDWALENKADRTAAKLRTLGLKTRTERGLPPRVK